METYFVITNKTRRLGWGYTTNVHQTSKGLKLDTPDRPEHEGTAKQILDAIYADRTFKSFQSGGTYYNTALFYNGKRIILVGDFPWKDDPIRVLEGMAEYKYDFRVQYAVEF